MTKIAPSILSADFSKLGQEIREVEVGGADYIHVDVMDGQYVPAITFGPLVVDAIKPLTSLPLDVHLMIENPEYQVPKFVEAGAAIITVHQEVCPHLHRIIQIIKKQGVKAGVAINPATSPELIKGILPDIDLVLVMTVNPGFGGQSFIPNAVQNIERIAMWRKEFGFDFEIEIDGGVNVETAKRCTDVGADVLVAGSAVFGSTDRKQAITDIRNAIKKVVK